MRVSCPFVLLAIFFAAESQCAPLNPLNVVNHLGGHLEGTLNSAPVAHNVLAGKVPSKLAHVGTPAAIGLLSGNIIDKRGLGFPKGGVSHLVPGMPSSDSLPAASSLSSMPTLPGLSSLPSTGAAPGLSNLPSMSSLPGASNLPSMPSLPGLNRLPSTGAVPGVSDLPLMGSLPSTSSLPSLPALNSLPATSSVPGLSSLPSVPGLMTKRGFGNFGAASGLPKAGSLPAFSSIPMLVNGTPLMPTSVPLIGSPTDLVNGFVGGLHDPSSQFSQ